MKRFCGTQVMMLMAGFAASSGWGQTADQAADAKGLLRQQIRVATRGMTNELIQDAMRSAEREAWRVSGSQIKFEGNRVEMAQAVVPGSPQPPQGPQMVQSRFKQFYGTDGIFPGWYEQGRSALNNHNYKTAVELFDKVIDGKILARTEGAYYWKAYALNKLGKSDEALAVLADLPTKFPQSSWLKDAKALQAEVQQAKGQPVPPENQADDDLKLFAINALVNTDADRAVPLLEGVLNNPKMAPTLKERALFLLAEKSRSNKSQEILGSYAKSGSNPDLQMMAVLYLGTYRSKDSRQLLADVYTSVSDTSVRRAVLRSLGVSRDVEHLTAIAKSEQNVQLRREAIRQLGLIPGDQALESLVSVYGSESDRQSKTLILSSLGYTHGAVKQLIEYARKESDPEMKKAAVLVLGEMKTKEAMDFMAELLK